MHNKMAQFINHYTILGARAAAESIYSTTKTANLARLIPRSRLGRLGVGVGAAGAGVAGVNAIRPEPSMMDSIGDSLNSMSEEDLMGYASMLGSLGSGGSDPYGMMGYSPTQNPYANMPGTMDDSYSGYDMSDIGDFDTAELDDDAMGYSRPMSPEEEAQYLSYYGG